MGWMLDNQAKGMGSIPIATCHFFFQQKPSIAMKRAERSTLHGSQLFLSGKKQHMKASSWPINVQ
jgi:hypothetical protein